jgi:cell wall-associated NlpC family hydrolase
MPSHAHVWARVKRLALALSVLVLSPVALAAVVSGPSDSTSGPTALALSEIPADLLPVYVSASFTCPGLPWQVLAAIGFAESHHADARADPSSGTVSPPIFGPPLDGSSGTIALADPGSPDGWAHALGPMQFLESTWQSWGDVAPDRPPGSTPDPQNAWDAIYTAAHYLCGGAQSIDDVSQAILRYNHSDAYVHDVLDKAAAYGLGASAPAGDVVLAGSGESVVAATMTQLGVPYVWGGETPSVGFDCSGLVQWSYSQIGVSLPRTTFGQVTAGVPVSVDDLRPGDLVFSRSVDADGARADLGHVAIYAGGGMVVVAPHTGDVVSVRPLIVASVEAARRIVQ